MLELGLVDEVAELLEMYGDRPEPPSLKMVGYRQVSAYLRGQVGYNRMTEASIAATRRLAKRQLTWMRGQPGLTWIDSDHPGAARGVSEYLESNPLMAAVPGSEGA
jgi:tRNA dimethylallyltransferase